METINTTIQAIKDAIEVHKGAFGDNSTITQSSNYRIEVLKIMEFINEQRYREQSTTGRTKAKKEA